ncbi:hypothetical protein DM860_013705 [Cuscuta australis]|uniref:Uncharacterized protein n=1 Tax=Cuscuta australis TaxID=267555 RepID=A0A328EEJ0_9ASTE|nr:hypothetical protein DM860_013705 [Cuscuta australis]
MGILKELMDCLQFICTFQLWRMAIFWTLSLVYSYLKLYLQNFSLHKHKPYPRLSPKDHSYASTLLSRPVCVITGASSGLGAAAAHALANEGFYVVLVGRSLERLSKVTSDIRRSEVDACLKAFEVDMTSFESIVKFKGAVDPGAVKTEIMRELPWGISHIAFISLKALGLLQTPEDAVGSILDASLALPVSSGEYFFGGKGRTLASSPLSYNSKISRDLWDTSNDLFRELQEALETPD